MRASVRLLVVLVSATVAGCQIRPTFTTGYAVTKGQPQLAAGSLAVKQFVEARPPRLYTTSGRLFLTYIPILPYVTLPWERLDESVNLLSEDVERYHVRSMPVAPPLDTYTYPISMPRAIADDLAGSGLFSEVVYVGDGDTSGYHYVLGGQVRASPLTNTVTSYGLGIAGVLLWILPIPMQKTTADVSIDLSLEDRHSGEVIWHDTISSEVSRIATLYNQAIIYGSGGAFSFNLLPQQSDVTTVDRDSLFQWHFESLRRSMEAAKPSLAHALAER